MVDSIGKIREPERELEVFEDRQRRRYIRGMVLTRLIAAAIVADGLLVSLEYRCLPPLVVSSALAIALIWGVRWVKGAADRRLRTGSPADPVHVASGRALFSFQAAGRRVYTPAVLYPSPWGGPPTWCSACWAVWFCCSARA